MKGAKDRFWMVNAAIKVSFEQVLFGQLNRMDVTGWFDDVEGLSSHDYYNGHEDKENTDNENLNKGPRDDCKERSAADENIDNQHGNHNITEKPPGSPPTDPPPQPTEPETFGLGGTSNEPPVGLDDYGLPITRPQAMDMEIFCYRWAVVDHLSMAQCAGFAGSFFNKVQHIWSSVQVS
jgi:hypothetical protein